MAITAEQKQFIDWQQGQYNPTGGGTIGGGNADPYNEANIKMAQEQLDTAASRVAARTAAGAPQADEYVQPWVTSKSSQGSIPVLQSNGIVGTAAQSPSTYSAAQTSADTVAGRMADLVNPNDPLNQAIATSYRGTANQRGLLNSSIGDSMVQDGIIKNALSIASPDAAAANTANQFNANAANQAGQFNSSAQNASNLLNQANTYDSAKTAAIQANTSTNMYEAQANTAANADSTIAANRLTTASSAVTSIMNNTSAYIASIDRTLSGEAQQALKDGYNTQAKVSLQIIGSLAGDVNLSKYIDSLFTV